jgi:sugar lactone lactonase YvrE
MKAKSLKVPRLGLVALLFSVALAHADNVFVSSYLVNSKVQKFSAGGVESSFGGVLPSYGHFGLTFDSNNMLYVANSGNNTIQKLGASGFGFTFASGLNGPFGLACDRNNNLYVANSGDATIVKISPLGVKTVFASGGGLSYPYGLAFDRRGDLYVGNGGGNGGYTILKYDANGVESVFAGDLSGGPTGLAFDSGGNLYVAEGISQMIEKFNPSGVGTVFVAGLNEPMGIAFDSSDNLFVTDASDNTITKYNLNGVGTVFASGLHQPITVAVQIIPEPSTWAVLMLGVVSRLGCCRGRARQPDHSGSYPKSRMFPGLPTCKAFFKRTLFQSPKQP